MASYYDVSYQHEYNEILGYDFEKIIITRRPGYEGRFTIWLEKIYQGRELVGFDILNKEPREPSVMIAFRKEYVRYEIWIHNNTVRKMAFKK